MTARQAHRHLVYLRVPRVSTDTGSCLPSRLLSRLLSKQNLTATLDGVLHDIYTITEQTVRVTTLTAQVLLSVYPKISRQLFKLALDCPHVTKQEGVAPETRVHTSGTGVTNHDLCLTTSAATAGRGSHITSASLMQKFNYTVPCPLSPPPHSVFLTLPGVSKRWALSD